MDISMFVEPAVIVIGGSFLIVFAMFMIGVMVALGAGIIGKLFDFFTDSIAGQESTNYGDNKKED